MSAQVRWIGKFNRKLSATKFMHQICHAGKSTRTNSPAPPWGWACSLWKFNSILGYGTRERKVLVLEEVNIQMLLLPQLCTVSCDTHHKLGNGFWQVWGKFDESLFGNLYKIWCIYKKILLLSPRTVYSHQLSSRQQLASERTTNSRNRREAIPARD